MDPTLTPLPSEKEPAMVTPGESTAGRRVDVPNENDVLCGRGGSINSHLGNEKFREFVEKRKRVYLTARFKREKRLIASSIVSEIRNMDPPGRFLAKTGGKNGYWYDIGDEKARDKTSQALRENAPTIRAEIETEINQQREEMKRREDEEQDTALETPSPHVPPHPSYYPPPAYGWDYYYSYYGYGHPPPPGHPPPGHPPTGHPPPPPHHALHHGPPPPHPPPSPTASAYPGHHADGGYQWAPSSPTPHAASLPHRGHEEFKEDCGPASAQEDEDYRLAMELQQKEKEEAFEDRKRRYREDPNRNRMSVSYVTPGSIRRPNTSYARDRGAYEKQPKVARVAKTSSGEHDSYQKASAAFAAMKVDDPTPSPTPAELTQEQRDHRLAVELQEKEDYAINSRREATFQTSRRGMCSNAYSKVQRTGVSAFMGYGKSDPNASAFGSTSDFVSSVPSTFVAWTKSSVSFGGQSATSDAQDGQVKAAHEKPPGLHKHPRTPSDSFQDGSQRRVVQFKDGANDSRRSMRTENSGGYSPINFQEDSLMIADDGNNQIIPTDHGADDNNSSLLSQVANHILNPWGSWDQSKQNSTDGGVASPSNFAAAQTQPQTVTSGHNPYHMDDQGESTTIEPDGHEVQLRDVLDELSMPPPEPRVEIDWPSRVGSCHTWIPESLEAGAASFFGNTSRRGSLSTFQMGISPVNSLEMDASAAGTEQFSCAGSVGGGSLCHVFENQPQGAETLPSPMHHRIIHQIPSWERSMRSKSPLSLGSVEDSDDSMIRVRHEKYDKPSGPAMSTIEDASPPPAARRRSQNSDMGMDWEESSHHPE